jgi:hypothetical protein
MNDKTDRLIENLSSELKPVKCLCHPALRFAPAIIIALVYLAIAVHVLGMRPDMPDKYHDLHFLFEVGLMLIISASAALSAIWLSIPDARGLRWVPIVPLSLFGVYVFWTGLRAYIDGGVEIEWHWSHCLQDAALMTAIPAAAMVFITRRGATTQPLTMALMIILAVTGMGYIGLRFTCMMDTIAHTTHYHLLPFTVLGVLLGLLAKRLFRW